MKEHGVQVEDADLVPELQSGLVEDYSGDSLEDIDAREKIQMKGHTLTTQESIHKRRTNILTRKRNVRL